jgi:FlgD Ig-like domain
MRFRIAPWTLSVCLLLLSPDARAQWQVDGLPICTAASGQFGPKIVSDDAGGAIMAWYDGRSGTFDYPIYAQRVNAAGVSQWAADGVALTVASGDFAIVSDGAGGAIVTWSGARAQRVNGSGVPLWTSNGVALSTASGAKSSPTIVSDHAGGAIIAWKDYRNNANKADIYAQRVDGSGVSQWAAGGVAVCIDTTDQVFPKIAADGTGGAIITWSDWRTYATTSSDVYAQRVNSVGVPQWTADGIAVCTELTYQSVSGIAPDAAGGAIVTWVDYRSGTTDIYAQRVSAFGGAQWATDGVAVCTATGEQSEPAIIPDGGGGAIVAWEDLRNGTENADIYAQQVDAAGVRQWTADGVALCTQPHYQYDPVLVSDGKGGAIVTWEDPRDGIQFDIFAQRVDAAGVPQWAADGVALSAAVGDQRNPTIASDGAGGAIAVWDDRRSGPATDIYVQHVTDPSNAVAIASFHASEWNGVVTLRSAFRSDLGVEAVNVYRAVGTDADPLIVIERVGDVRGDRFEYLDDDVVPGQSYRYRIGVVDADGEFFSPIVTVSVKAIAVSLAQNQPNPFNPATTIRFVLPARENVTLTIYDANGHLVRTLVNEVQSHGAHEVTWDGRDANNVVMGSGVYFYRLRAGKVTESKKMVLLK